MIDSFQGEYRFLSNFWPSKMFLRNEVWLTVEHYYQAMKATNEKDRALIRNAGTPGKAKRLSRTIALRKDWDDIKDKVMAEALNGKFKIKDLAAKLDATKPHLLVEGNMWHDNYWGSCGCVKCVNKEKLNKLGNMLMYIRSKL